jgi:hypothetical protein
MTHDVCAECGFDGGRWDERDTVSTIRGLALRWRWTIEGMDAALVQQRIDPGTWSIAEYTDHLADVLWMMRFAVEAAASDPGIVLGDAIEPGEAGVHRQIDLDAALPRLDDEVRQLHEVAVGIEPEDWGRHYVIGEETLDIGWSLRHGVHDATHHLHDVGRIRHALGAGAPSATGTVAAVNTSGGGVPKASIGAADVDFTGVVGDRQAARQHHGRPWQALCLWSTEVIDDLRDEGHPIGLGDAGENLTVRGVDWTTIRPGTLLRIGSMRAEVSAYAEPCTKNGQWFADGDSRRIDHARHPGWSRVYATVLEPGRVAEGDDVLVEPR